MTDHQPEGTQLVTQLGDAVGGPEVPGPDPETETVDLRRKLWNVQRLGESMAEDRDETVRRCGEQVLATLGDAALPVAAVLDPEHLQAALEALSIAIAGAEYEHLKKRYKAAWAHLDALEDEPFTLDVGHPTAADRAMVARATGGGIRSREVQPEFGTEGDEGHG